MSIRSLCHEHALHTIMATCGAFIFSGCCLPSTACCLGWSGLTMSAPPLAIERVSPASSVVLHVEMNESDGSTPRTSALPLTGRDGAWTLSGDSIFDQGGCPGEAVLTFELEIDGVEGAGERITVTVSPDYGGQETVVLWEGWTVQLDWGGWTT